MDTIAGLNVSRETLERLQIYQSLVEKWNNKINLVARSTLSDLWTRHLLDSAQLYELAPPNADRWVDLGSGGGFPGLVIAIMAAETRSPSSMILVESDLRKAVFLRTVLRETGISGKVISERIEDVSPLGGDVVSARALAKLDVLLGFAARHMSMDGVAIFPKGENWRQELSQAQSKWHFECQVDKSITNPTSVIIRATGVTRV